MAWWKLTKGIYSLEVLISVALFAFIISGIFLLYGSSLSGGTQLLKEVRAEAIVSETMNAVRSIRDRDETLLTTGSHGLNFTGDAWELLGTSDQTEGSFLRTVDITALDLEGYDVTVTVTWPFRSRFTTYSASTRLTNWKNVEVWGDWGNPQIASSIDVGPQGKATGIDYEAGVIYLTADISSGSVPSFFTVDVTDPAAPVVLDSVVLGEDLLGVVKVPGENYAYTVGDETGAELSIFDVTDPSNVFLSSQQPLADEGLVAIVHDTLLIVGTSSGIELFDITNPSNPSLLGAYTTSARVSGIDVYGDYLFAATALDAQELMIFSITDPSSPTVAGSLDLTGSADGFAATVDGSFLYLGRDNNSSPGQELYKLSLTDPTAPVVLDAEDVGGSIQRVLVAGPYVYVACSSANQEFQLFRSSGNDLTYITGLNMSQVATGLAFDENTIFISLRSNDAFQIIQPAP